MSEGKKMVSTRCRYPFMWGSLPVSCGRCLPCRIKKRKIWTHRMMLELRLHGDASFMTLTYDPESKHYPEGGVLVPKHLTDFIKRIRRNFTSNPIRYFAVGEYGERSGHPHYHAILFGYPTCSGSMCYRKKPIRCQACEIAFNAWGKGHIFNGDVTKDSCAYVAGYVTKGWTTINEYTNAEGRLGGRPPEFARMSRSPGLGAGAARAIADNLSRMSLFSEAFLGASPDVPGVLISDNKRQPVGRYLKTVMRRRLGFANPERAPGEVIENWAKEVHRLYEEDIASSPNPEERRFTLRSDSQKKILLQQLSSDAIKNIEAKFNKYNLVGAL